MAENLDTIVVEEAAADMVSDLTVEEPIPSMDASDFVVEEEKIPGSEKPVEQEAVDSIPKETNWADDKDHSKFHIHVEIKKNKIPKHDGANIPGCERALAFVKDLQNELTKAMRTDFDGKIDESWADKQYKEFNDWIDRLKKQIDKLRAGTETKNKVFASPEVRLVAEGKCDKCEGDVPTWHDVENDRVICLKCNAVVGSEGLEKIANTPTINVYVSAFERACVGMIINGAVSQGKNIEDLYHKVEAKYKFTDREKLSIRQILSDYGYPQLWDRAKIEEDDGKNDGELMSNYYS